MRSTFEPLGKYVRLVDERNTDMVTESVLGINIDKYFMPSVANVIGTDLSTYKLLRKGRFACNPMNVGRDGRLPVARYEKDIPAIVSPAYFMFEIINEREIAPEYLMLCFRRPDFDRMCWFRTDASVRGGITWEDICALTIPVPPVDEQRKIVHDYQVITDRISLLQKEKELLIELIKNTYKHVFNLDNYPMVSMSQICSKIGSGATPKGGKDSYYSEGISLIRSTNVYDYFFSFEGLAHINDEQADALSNVIVEPYDVLFNITGVSIARCCIVPNSVLPARVNQHVMILRPYAGKYMSYYLMITLCEQSNKNRLLGIGQAGSTREAINKQEMEAFKIPLPDSDAINLFGANTDACFRQIHNAILQTENLLSIRNAILSQL